MCVSFLPHVTSDAFRDLIVFSRQVLLVWTYRSAQGEPVQPAAECLTADQARQLQQDLNAQVYDIGTTLTLSVCAASRVMPRLVACAKQGDLAKRELKLRKAIGLGAFSIPYY